MKGFPFKRQLILLGVVILLIGVMIPLETFAKSASGEPHHPSQPPHVTMKTDTATGKSDPSATIMEGCPASAPINPTPFSSGDVVTGTATFTSTDTNEASESEEANNTLEVFITIPPIAVTLNHTRSFSFTATAGDQLFACFAIYDGDEVGTINYTVTSKSEASETRDEITDLIGNIVGASDKFCEVLKCTPFVKVPLGLLNKLFTIFNLGKAIGQEKILGDKLAALNAAIKKYGLHSHQACVAADQVFVADRNLHATLVGLVPGLEFIFPLPAGGTPPCR